MIFPNFLIFDLVARNTIFNGNSQQFGVIVANVNIVNLYFNNVTAINQASTGTGSFFECFECNFTSIATNSYFGNNVASGLTSYGGVFYASCAGKCNGPPSMSFE